MKTLDTFSKRILVVAVSISMVLLSLSAFMLTVERVTAGVPQKVSTGRPTYVGIGAVGNRGYFLEWTPDGRVCRVRSFDLGDKEVF